MKKIIFVNNNMKVGGVQKSLYNLLWSIDTERGYDVTLLLFSKTGAYADKLPQGVKVIECTGPYRYLGKSQGEYGKGKLSSLIRGSFAAVSKIFGRYSALRLMSLFQPNIEGQYDYAVSFLHNGRRKAFYGGTQEFVLRHIKADKKIAFLHGDYKSCGADHKENNRMLSSFDKIAACSEGCKDVFESALPDLKEKSAVVRNFHRIDEIKLLADEAPVTYADSFVNVILVARLSREKGVDRAIKAVAYAKENGAKVNLHIIGDGSGLQDLKDLAKNLDVAENVFFYGEQSNPYKYIKNADLMLLASYHEAAPMVIDEARLLAVPVLTTKTTSSKEMVEDEKCGWVCENTQESLNEAFLNHVGSKEQLVCLKQELQSKGAKNDRAMAQLKALLSDAEKENQNNDE